jgi:hypothetical protein
MNKTQRVLNALANGEELTAKQIASRYKAANPADVIFRLRNQGYAIYLNERKNAKGTVMKYRLGTPRQSFFAA